MKFFFRRLVFALLCFSLCSSLLPSLLHAEEEASLEALEKINQRIDEASKDLDQKREKKSSLLDELEKVDNDLDELSEKINDVREKVSFLGSVIKEKKIEVTELRSSVNSLEKTVKKRLAALFKTGETGLVAVIFSEETPDAMARRYDFFSRIVRRDRRTLSDYRMKVGELNAAVEELEQMRMKQENLKKTYELDRMRVVKARSRKKDLLERIAHDEEALVALLDDLTERAERMEALLKKLESEKTEEYTQKTAKFEELQGKLPWPADGKIKVGFGRWKHPDLGTDYDSQGLEIKVGKDRPVRAVCPGKVVFANNFKGYGKLMIVDHGESYYTLYARASVLKKQVGDRVDKGDLLALSGYAGDDTLYFEIRHGGTPLDPMTWLTPR